MKKIFKSFTFYFVLLSIVAIYMHQIGQDSKSIILISFNPLLNMLASSDTACVFMNSGFEVPCDTIMGSISIYWYIGCVVSMTLYGVILDTIKFIFKRAYKKSTVE